MIQQVARITEIVTLAGSLTSIAYYAFCLRSAQSFLRHARPQVGNPAEAERPPVSILKPLKGTDPEMYESFRSHCLQDYPEYEIIFGVSDPADPSVEFVRRLQAEFPQRTIRLVVCEQSLGANTKVSNLVQMLPHVASGLLIVNDSDIRVESNYLASVLSPLADPRVGMVTCLYRGIGNASLGSRLESLGISTDFSPGVLVARQLEGLSFGLGSTLAFRRDDLRAIGGFESLLDYLADDYQLGNGIAGLGLKIELASSVVETRLPRYTLRSFLDHQLRWARTLRDSRFWGYVGLGSTYGLPWALLALLCSGLALWSWWLLLVTIAMRVGVAVFVGKTVLRDPQVPRYLPLLLLRDILAVFIWLASFVGNTVTWRGDSFRLKRGKLVRITPTG